MNWKTIFSFALALLWLVACAPAAEQPTSTPPAEPTPTNTNENTISLSMGITAEGAFYLGSGTAPVQMFDYSNFLWPTCRAYVLGPEKELETSYIANGQLQLIFWPALDGVPAATNLHVLAHCAGQQDPALFWKMHDHIFENQTQYNRIDQAGSIELGVSLGAVEEPLAECINSGEGLEMVEALDDIRRERGISGRPVFQIGDQQLYGLQSFEVFSDLIDNALE